MTKNSVIFIFLITSIFSIFKLKNKKDYQFLFLIITFILLIITIFRNGNELNDYDIYVKMYEGYNENFVRSYAEPTFLIISAMLNKLALSAIAMFAVYGFLGLWLKVSLIKKISPYYYLSLVSYISYEFINQELIAIRAGVAIGLILYSIIYIYKKQFIKFLFFIVMATLFHYSAIVCLPLYIFRFITKKWRIILLLLSLAFIFFDISFLADFIPIPYVRNKVVDYLKRDNNSLIHLLFRFTILYRYILFFLFSKYEKPIIKYDKYISLELSFLSYGLIMNNVFSFNEVLSYRFSMLCFSVEYLLIPDIMFIIKEKNIAKILIVFLSSVNLLYSILVSHIFH